MALRGIKLVTLDATNTILKFRVPPYQYYTMIAKEYGFKGEENQVKDRMMNSFKIMGEKYPNFGKNSISWEDWWRNIVKFCLESDIPNKSNVDIVATRLIDDFKTCKCWYLADGANNFYKTLKDKGMTVGVISNSDPRLNDILKNVSVFDKFNFIVISYDVGYSKPDKRIFDHALKQCAGTSANEVLHIGDDLAKDYNGARAAGWHALLINKAIKEERPRDPHVFSSLEELNSAIQQDKLVL